MRRALLAAPLVALALVAAGCGSSSGASAKASGGGSIPDGAAQVSAKVQVFATLDSSFGDQWKAFNALVDRFPIRGEAIDSIHQSLAKDGVDFDKDIKATIGPETDIVAWNVSQPQKSVVGLTKPKDKAGFEAALKKGSEPSVYYEDGDWVVFADKQATLDAFKALGGGKLADESDFKDAFGALSDSALGRVYVNANGLQQQLQAKLHAQASPLGSLANGDASIDWAAGAVEALKDGFKVDALAHTAGKAKLANFDAKVLDNVPSGAFLAAAFDGSGSVSLGSQLRNLKSNPQLAQGLAQFQAMTGVTIDQLAKIFGGKSVLYVRAGTPIPEVTFIEEDVDAKQSVATLDTLVTRLGAQFQATVTNATVAGVQVKQLTIQRFPVYFGVVDGKLILTTSQAGITDLKNGTSKLVDQDAFKKTIDAADLSTGETAGLLYVDVPSAISNLSGLASVAHATMPAEAQANTKNLRGFVLGGHADDDHTGRGTAFLGVQPGPAEPATHTTTG